MMVVAKLTVDHTGYKTEYHSLSELYTEDTEIVAASELLDYQFFTGRSSPSLREPAAAMIKSINAQIPRPPNVNSIASPVPILPM